jgi:ferrous iron transport protein B
MPASPIIVAIVGNPNTGKSTLFNALSGLRQQTGNYPGVTVEMHTGRCVVGDTTLNLIDLPGTYSLAPRSPDEMVSIDVLLGRRAGQPAPDVIVSVVDATNLDRHLYLTSQLAEMGKPVVLAVNMTDVAANQGVRIDYDLLAKETGLTVVPIQANKGVGLDRLKAALAQAPAGQHLPHGPTLPVEVKDEAEKLREAFALEPYLAERLLFDVNGYVEQFLSAQAGTVPTAVAAARARLAAAGMPVPAAEARARFAWVRGVVAATVKKPAARPITLTDRLDRVLTHRVWGTLAFLAVMALLFVSIFFLAKPVMDGIKDGFDRLAAQVGKNMTDGPLKALISDGVIKGVGSVIVFLPQIVILFGFIAVLEDCGYMARAAFLMDRLMSRCGLSGKSFIPLLSSVACAVPGIMATRVIENRRDRFATILIAPLMSCSARLPVYSLLIGAFVATGDGYSAWERSVVQGLVLFALYLIGFVTAPLVALVLKRTLLRGETPVFVMELPSYQRPSLRIVFRRMADAGWAFLKRAGTFILASMVLIWAASYFPRTKTGPDNSGRYDVDVAYYEDQAKAATDDEVKEKADAEVKRLKAEWQRNSYLGRAGRALEPVVKPLGWDWKIGVATLASFPAREVIVGTLGILYSVDEEDETKKQEELGKAIRSDWAVDAERGKYGLPVALSVMVFFALCCQCVSTLVVIRRETRSWAWPAFTFVYMTALAYLGALVTYQIGRLVLG